MKKVLFLIAFVVCAVGLKAQVITDPHGFPLETSPGQTNFEFYSRGGTTTTTPTNKRATFNAVRAGMLPACNLSSVAFVPTSTGNTTNKGDIVTDPNGDVWFIDGDGDAIKLNTVPAGSIGATQLASTAVTAGSYTNTNITVDADGRITSASNGSGGGISDGDKGDITVSASGATWTIGNGVIVTAKIASTAVDSSKLATDAVTFRTIKNGTIGKAEIASNGIDTINLATSAVTGRIIANGSIFPADLASSSVTTAKIASNAVDSSKIATDAVTSRTIKNGTIVGKDISQMGATSGQVLAWSGTDWLPATAGGGSGTVTSVTVTTANGVSGTVANSTTTPAISISLGAITPTSVTTGALGLQVKDADASNKLSIGTGTNLAADQTLTLNQSSSSVTMNLEGGTTGQVLEWNNTTKTWAPGTDDGSGTVTSVALSGGTTGLAVTGSPITSSGTFTLGGVLDEANGGTGGVTTILGTDFTTSSTTGVSVTGLATGTLAVGTYSIICTITYVPDATTTGAKFAGTCTATSSLHRMVAKYSNTTSSAIFDKPLNGDGTQTSTVNSSSPTVGSCTYTGTLEVISGSGTWSPVVFSEVAGGSITVLAGSSITVIPL